MTEIIAKIQKIGGGTTPSPDSGAIAFSFIEEPSERELLQSHGSLYAVIDFVGVTAESVALMNRLVWDTLKESYFGSLEGTPAQSLEKAMTAVRSRLLGLSLNPLPGLESKDNLECNLAVVVKWGKYLYTALLGGTKAFIIRGTGVKEVTLDEGLEVGFSSHLLEDDDVILLAASKVAEDLSSENLLTKLATLGQEIEKAPDRASRLILLIKNLEPPTDRVTLTSRVGVNKNWRFRAHLLPKLKEVLHPAKKTKFLGLLTLALGVVLIGSLVVSFKGKNSQSGQDNIDSIKSDESTVLGDTTTNLASLVNEALSNATVNLDKTKTALSAAELAWRDLSFEDKKLPKVKSLKEQLDTLVISTYQIQKISSFKEASMPAEILIARQNITNASIPGNPKITATATYNGVPYFVTPSSGQIYKSTNPWLKTPASFDDATGLSIDGSLYVLTGTSIKKFYKGEPASFTLSGFDKPLTNAVAIFTNDTSDNLYTVEGGSTPRLTVFDKTGLYQFQVLLPNLSGMVELLSVNESGKNFTLVMNGKAWSGVWQ